VSTVDLDALPRERTTTSAMRIVVTSGAVAGQVIRVDDHPRAEKIWLAWVDTGGASPEQIVFGGHHRVVADTLVPVAPPGARVVIHRDRPKAKKMRSRSYRGERSHGMLCSLDELGWAFQGPDEVATLQNVVPGESLDKLTTIEQRRTKVVRNRSFLVAPLTLIAVACWTPLEVGTSQLVTK
jgi:tRNA-binding EMAP/Myf-like protein